MGMVVVAMASACHARGHKSHTAYLIQAYNGSVPKK
jgi:hypothetical protein